MSDPAEREIEYWRELERLVRSAFVSFETHPIKDDEVLINEKTANAIRDLILDMDVYRYSR